MTATIKKEGLPKRISWRVDRKCYLGRVTYQGQPHVLYDDSWKRLNVRLEELRIELKKGTYIKECILTLNEWFGKKKLKDVTVDDIQTLYNNLCDRDFAAGTIKLMRATLNGCFKKAVNNRMITFNPVHLVEIPKCKEKKEKYVFTKDE